MGRGEGRIHVAAGFCISMAIALCLLPLRIVGSWILAVFVHEFCHCVAIVFCGADIQKIHLSVRGATIISDINTDIKTAICSLAGPAGGLLLLAFRKTLPISALCAMIHSVYNMLPLDGLDGGRALRCFLNAICDNITAQKACVWVDRITRCVLFVMGCYISWRLHWLAFTILMAALLFRRQSVSKSTCKYKGM